MSFARAARLGVRRLSSARTRVLFLAASFLVIQGCGPDSGPPPDEAAKNNPPVAKTKGGESVSRVGGGLTIPKKR